MHILGYFKTIAIPANLYKWAGGLSLTWASTQKNRFQDLGYVLFGYKITLLPVVNVLLAHNCNSGPSTERAYRWRAVDRPTMYATWTRFFRRIW